MKDTKHIRKKATRKEGRKEGSNRGERVGNERKEGQETRRNKECDLSVICCFCFMFSITCENSYCRPALRAAPPPSPPVQNSPFQSKLAQV